MSSKALILEKLKKGSFTLQEIVNEVKELSFPVKEDQKTFILEKIESGIHTPEKLKGWIRALPGPEKLENSEKTSIKWRKGDVLMHPIFHHPYVLLKKKKGFWICSLITSEPKCPEILEPCEARFFMNNFLTRVLFSVKEPLGRFMFPYDNPKQLKRIQIELAEILK